ncbi:MULTISPECIES: MFS transporter [Kocuria]|nr:MULTISPECIES: MFS transporter [Kocuria]
MPVMGSVLLAPVLPTMSKAFASTPGSEILVPVVLTAPALVIALLAPLAGEIADRVGRKTLLVVSMVLYSIFGTAPLWLDSLHAIVASRVGVGIAEAAIMTVCTTLITDYYSGKKRDQYLGMQVMMATFAATAFFALGGALGAQSWRAPFWLYVSAVIIAVPMAFVLWEPQKNTDKAKAVAVPWAQILVPASVTLFAGVVFYALIVQLPYVLTGLGVTSVGIVGAGSALASLATAVGAVSFRFTAHHGPGKLLPVAFGLSGVGLVLIWFSSSIVMAMVGAVITSAGTGLLLPTLLTWAVSGLKLEQRGRGTGIWTGCLYVGQFLSPILLTIGAGVLGGLPVALGVLGCLSLVAAGFTALTRPDKHSPLH